MEYDLWNLASLLSVAQKKGVEYKVKKFTLIFQLKVRIVLYSIMLLIDYIDMESVQFQK